MTDQRATRDRRADAVDSVIDLLRKVRQRMAYVDQRMDDMAAGWPSGGEGGSELHEGEALEYQSSTEANALNPKRDVVGPDRRRRKQILGQLSALVAELDDIDRKYLGNGDGSRPPDPPGCQVVGRFKGRDGRPYWEPVGRDGKLRTDGKAFLANAEAEFNHGESICVGQWAYDFGRRAGRWPNKAEVEQHLAGKDVRVVPVEDKPKRERRGWYRGTAA